MATCPECDAEIELDETDLEEVEVGDPWSCDACGSHLRVASVDPLEFDSDEEEDEDDEEEDEDEEDDDLDDDFDDDDDADEEEEDGGWDE